MDGDGAECRVVAPFNNISCNHDFFIKCSTSENKMLLYAKQYSTSQQWEPQEGCKLLLNFPNVSIHGAEQMPYDDHKTLAPNGSKDEQKLYWMRCIEVKQKNIEHTKKYVGDQNVEWSDNYIDGYWPLPYLFMWNIGAPQRCPRLLICQHIILNSII